jgi:hypothetical protein
MVTLGRKGKATLLVSVLLVVFTLVLAALAFTYKPVPQPGEGYVDPASGIHITPSGDITDSSVNSSNTIIQRDGNVYTLTGNITNMVTIEKSNIVFDGKGFSFVGSQGLRLEKGSNVTVKDLDVETHYLHLLLQYAQNCVLQNVTSSITLSYSDNNLISNCSLGLDLENSNYNTIKNCISGEITLLKSNGNSILYNSLSMQGPSLGNGIHQIT